MSEQELDFKNSLLKRREVEFEISADGNPGYEKAKEEVASKFSVSEDLIVIKTLKSKFGTNTFLIDAFIYDSKEDLESVEPKAKVKEGEGEAAQPTPKPEEVKAEEKVEETKEEDPKEDDNKDEGKK
jgi:ribosomal protein S24E